MATELTHHVQDRTEELVVTEMVDGVREVSWGNQHLGTVRRVAKGRYEAEDGTARVTGLATLAASVRWLTDRAGVTCSQEQSGDTPCGHELRVRADAFLSGPDPRASLRDALSRTGVDVRHVHATVEVVLDVLTGG